MSELREVVESLYVPRPKDFIYNPYLVELLTDDLKKYTEKILSLKEESNLYISTENLLQGMIKNYEAEGDYESAGLVRELLNEVIDRAHDASVGIVGARFMKDSIEKRLERQEQARREQTA